MIHLFLKRRLDKRFICWINCGSISHLVQDMTQVALIWIEIEGGERLQQIERKPKKINYWCCCVTRSRRDKKSPSCWCGEESETRHQTTWAEGEGEEEEEGEGEGGKKAAMKKQFEKRMTVKYCYCQEFVRFVYACAIFWMQPGIVQRVWLSDVDRSP